MRRILFCLIILCSLAVQAEEKPVVTVAVMEFASKGGVTQEQMDALGDMVANQIRGLGKYEVIGKSDIRAALHLEQQKQMLGCDSESCMAEIGGALGVPWMVIGNISLFGKTFLLNLKLLDVGRVKVIQGLSKTIKGGEDALVEAVPAAVLELMAAAHKDLTGEKVPESVAVEKATSTPKVTPTPTRQPARKKSEWFTLPDRGGAFVRGTLGGLIGFKGEGVTEYGSENAFLRDAAGRLEGTMGGAILGLEGGYSFYPWLRVFGRMGGYVTSGDVTSGDATEEKLSRNGFDLAVGLESAIPLNSWAEPLVYTALGVGFMVMKDSGEDTVLQGTALLFDMGLGLNLYLNPHWFVGLRAGVVVRVHSGMDYADGSNMEYDEDLVGNLVGGFLGLSSGYQF